MKELENTSRRKVPMEHVQRAQQQSQAQLAAAQKALAEEQARSAELRTKLGAEKAALAAKVAELEANSKKVVAKSNPNAWRHFGVVQTCEKYVCRETEWALCACCMLARALFMLPAK